MEKLKKVAADFGSCNAENSDACTEKLIDAISDAMKNHTQVIVPVSLPQEVTNHFGKRDITADDIASYGDNFRLNICTLTTNLDETVYAAFTDYDEVKKGEAVDTVTIDIDRYLEMVVFDNDLAGVIINPFGEGCFVAKDFIRIIFKLTFAGSMADKEKYPPMPQLNTADDVADAVVFATECHRGFFRKGTDIPYIVHPMEAAQILVAVQADYNLVIAGLLHDVVEDAGVTIGEIRDRFGDDVADLVAGHSENKDNVWYARKIKTISDLPHEDIRSQLLTLADKLSNIRSMYRDYRQFGNSLWERFNAPKEMQSWYYGGIVDGLADLQNIPETADFYNELNNLYKELFVDFYLDLQNSTLYQRACHGECYKLYKGNPQWHSETGDIPADAVAVTREYAQRTEQNWNEPFWQMHNDDMADRKISLFRSENKSFCAVVEDEKLTVYVKANGRNGAAENLFCLDEENTHRFFAQLRMITGITDSTSKLMKTCFGDENCVQKFADFCSRTDVNCMG